MLKVYHYFAAMFLGFFLLTGLSNPVLAQCDPRFSAATYTGTSSVGGVATVLTGETGQLKFNFGVGPQPGCNAGAGNAAGGIMVTIVFPAEYSPTSAADISGPQASLYNWTYDPATRTMTGINNAPIPTGGAALFTVNVVGNTVTAGSNAPLTDLTWSSPASPPITNAATANDHATAGMNVDAPLPVTLTVFKVTKEEKTARLDWATTAETNSDYFEIQRSTTGKDWYMLSKVSSHGESTVENQYHFTDINPVLGSENLYRLKMVDKDATYAYSRIQSVKFDETNAPKASIYPNPSSDKVFIQDMDLTQIKSVSIIDMNGRPVFSNNGATKDGINVSKLIPGTYILHVKSVNDTVSNHKIVIAR